MLTGPRSSRHRQPCLASRSIAATEVMPLRARLDVLLMLSVLVEGNPLGATLTLDKVAASSAQRSESGRVASRLRRPMATEAKIEGVLLKSQG